MNRTNMPYLTTEKHEQSRYSVLFRTLHIHLAERKWKIFQKLNASERVKQMLVSKGKCRDTEGPQQLVARFMPTALEDHVNAPLFHSKCHFVLLKKFGSNICSFVSILVTKKNGCNSS